MPDLKKLSHDGIPAALLKAERYRLLNEPWAAESICRDVLAAEPDNARAQIMLILSLSDQFGQSGARGVQEVLGLAKALSDEYSRAYYTGIVAERQAKAQLVHGGMGSGHNAYAYLQQAMQAYTAAEAVRPAGDDSALLRWNTCVRMLKKYPNLEPAPLDQSPSMLE